jgi:hypothetical protein
MNSLARADTMRRTWVHRIHKPARVFACSAVIDRTVHA